MVTKISFHWHDKLAFVYWLFSGPIKQSILLRLKMVRKTMPEQLLNLGFVTKICERVTMVYADR